jgi:hypothetical protein
MLEDLHLTPERAVRRRAAALGQRLSSLNLPAPLRRALIAALAEVELAPAGPGAPILLSLVAPVRECLGPEAAELLTRAGRGAAQRTREGS